MRMTKETDDLITISKSALLELLREHLSVSISTDIEKGNYGFADAVKTKVVISLDGEEIASDTAEFSLPLTKEQKGYY